MIIKKSIVLFVIALYTASMYASILGCDVMVDKTDEKGIRNILTETGLLYKIGTHRAEVSFGCIDYGTRQDFYIFIDFYEGNLQMSEGDRLLMKLDNDSIIEIRSAKNIGASDYKIKGNGEIYISALYQISESQLEAMKQKNLIKIRVEHSLGEFDRDITESFARFRILMQWGMVKKALETKKDFYDDF